MFTYLFLIGTTPNVTGITIKSQCEGLPFYLCKSRGLTRDFVAYTTNGFDVQALNPYSKTIYLFFVYALVSRIVLSIITWQYSSKRLLIIDITILISFFLYALGPLVWI
jgi:hypothetical protein